MKIKNSNNQELDIEAEIADNFLSQSLGLMFRNSLKENSGMLFTFEKEAIYSFWMFCTKIPLDAIFIDEKGLVVEIIAMEPCNGFTCPQYTPKNKSKYVLEVNLGFAKKNSILAGKSRLILDSIQNWKH